MKRIILLGATVLALTFVGSAAASFSPWVYDPGHTGCVTSTVSGGVLHLAKNCPTTTNASAGASINGVAGQTFTSASFTLANAGQCQGGSPRFNVVAGGTTYFLGCNNVTPTINSDGTATYTFTAATIAAGGNQVAVPSGTISTVDVLIDVQGTADVSNITFNGTSETPTPGHGHHRHHGHHSHHGCPPGHHGHDGHLHGHGCGFGEDHGR
jgi:hypothetical protein